MKTEETNKLIAEFMGNRNYLYNNDKSAMYFILTNTAGEELIVNYNNDWGLLMEVVEKIETTSYNVPEKFRRGFMKNTFKATGVIYSDYDDREEFLGWSSRCELGFQILWDSTMLGEDVKKYNTKIEAVYNACVEFIKWHNSANKN